MWLLVGSGHGLRGTIQLDIWLGAPHSETDMIDLDFPGSSCQSGPDSFPRDIVDKKRSAEETCLNPFPSLSRSPHWVTPYLTSGGTYGGTQRFPADLQAQMSKLIAQDVSTTNAQERTKIYEQLWLVI